ncbi:fungal specific transcription factor domain-containing protein [Colletotrichum tofieldiae]|nr:fungal specific transcription factor domain-containing protein [Colletotrichum tofieldiae]
MTQSSTETPVSKTTTPSDISPTLGALEPLHAAITSAFFAFVGDSPSPITDIFSRSFMRPYLRTSIPVRAVVTTIGSICLEFQKRKTLARKKAAAAAIMKKDRDQLNEFLERLTAPDSHDQHIILLYGILMMYAEFMTSEAWVYFQATFRKLSAKIQEQFKEIQRRPLLYFDRGLLMNFSMMGTFYSLVCFGDTFLVDLELYDSSPFEDVDSLNGQIRINSAILHHYTKFMEQFARLHHSTVNDRHLTGEVPEEELKEALSRADLMQKGRDIVESSGAAIDVMENLRGGAYDDDGDGDETDFCILREAYYHYSLMGLTRTFWDPIWKLVDEDLPHVGDMPDLEAHGEFVRERIAQRMPVVGMEAWSYLIILIGVGMESSTWENRKRLTELFNDIMGKGFASAGAFLADAKLAWGMNTASVHNVPGPLSSGRTAVAK